MTTGGLLAIFAHPDDETFGVGGTMARYADNGVPVTMVCATRGEVGEIAKGSPATPETLGQFREQELRDAMAILGVTDVRFLDYRDSGMKGTDDNKNPRAFMNAPADAVVPGLVRVIRERRPDVVVTWDESGGYGHPDHVATHHHATAAFRAAADASRYPQAGEPWAQASLFYTSIPMEEFGRVMEEMRKRGIAVPDFGEDEEIASLPRLDANCVIDVSDVFDRKIRAMLAHSSQITPDDAFMSMPEDIQRSFFGREFFHRAHPPVGGGAMLSDLL
jgi:N-acetyl-1-D-myo-inositol-2-amino-2-deoxy-alpha-D-glucopyranoside deacetylase